MKGDHEILRGLFKKKISNHGKINVERNISITCLHILSNISFANSSSCKWTMARWTIWSCRERKIGGIRKKSEKEEERAEMELGRLKDGLKTFVKLLPY